jgi:hypothetical protein
MATSFIRDSSSSAFALVLAYSLVLLSLWKVDTGLAERRPSTALEGSSAVKTTLASIYEPALLLDDVW